MVLLQTLGSVDMPGSGPRKMPSPRAYVPIVIVWIGLQLLADTGKQRGAATAGWIIVLTGTVLGPFGQRLIGLLNSVANQFGVPATGDTSTVVTSSQQLV